MSENRVTMTEQMLLSAVRYGSGRRTYIVTDTIGQVQAVWADLTPRMRGLILRDVSEALEFRRRLGETLGDRCDDDAWRGLLAWADQRPEPVEVAQ